jgi:hypothetical protein
MNWKGFERERSWPNPRTNQEFACGTKEDNENPVRIAGISAEIRTEHLLNRSVERYHYTGLLDRE